MADAAKVLGQVNPAATTATTLYTVPAATSAIVSSINACNQNSVAATFRVAIRPVGATLAALHYLAYDVSCPGNDSISIVIGATLATTDVVTVYASTATMSFSAFGMEIT